MDGPITRATPVDSRPEAPDSREMIRRSGPGKLGTSRHLSLLLVTHVLRGGPWPRLRHRRRSAFAVGWRWGGRVRSTGAVPVPRRAGLGADGRARRGCPAAGPARGCRVRLRNLLGNPQTPLGKRPAPFECSSLTSRYESSAEISIRRCGGCDHRGRSAGPDRPGGVRSLTSGGGRHSDGLILPDVCSRSPAVAGWGEFDGARQPADRGRQDFRRPRCDH